MKKLLSVVLTLVMIFFCWTTAFAAEKPVESEAQGIIDCGNIQWIVDLPFWPADDSFPSHFAYSFFAFLIDMGVFFKSVDSLTGEVAKDLMKNGDKSYYIFYAETVSGYAEENKLYDDGEIDVVFIGDSLTAGYDVKGYYPEYLALNRGIGGDKTFTLKKRLSISVLELKPKVCVMLIGGNNMNTMFEDYEDILISFKENMPETKIVLVSHAPTSDPIADRNETFRNNNLKIKLLAQKYGHEFVDVYTHLFDVETGKLKAEYTVDGAHFTKEGYSVFNAQLKPVVDSLLNNI